MVELCQQLSRSWQGCLGAHSTGRAVQGAGDARWGFAGGGFIFPSLKGCGVFNKLLCCNRIAACSNQECLVSS